MSAEPIDSLGRLMLGALHESGPRGLHDRLLGACSAPVSKADVMQSPWCAPRWHTICDETGEPVMPPTGGEPPEGMTCRCGSTVRIGWVAWPSAALIELAREGT